MQRAKESPAENPSTLRSRKYRESLRHAGLRPLQIWVPDTTNPLFALECKRQSLLANASDDHHWHAIIPNLTDPKP